jgi:hypothetical protein
MPPNRSSTWKTSSSCRKRGSNDIVRPMLLAFAPDSRQSYVHRRPNGLVQPPVHSSHNDSVDGSLFSIVSNGWTHPTAGLPDDVSDQITGSSSELVSRRALSFHTPTTPTSSSDGDHFYFNGEAGSFGQCSPDAEQELQGIRGTNRELYLDSHRPYSKY